MQFDQGEHGSRRRGSEDRAGETEGCQHRTVYDDALRRRIAHQQWLGVALGDGEAEEWSVTAMCLEYGAGLDNEGYLTLTNRRVLFRADSADPLGPPRPEFPYTSIARIRSERGPMKTAMAGITTTSGAQWHFVTGRKSVRKLKKLARRHRSH